MCDTYRRGIDIREHKELGDHNISRQFIRSNSSLSKVHQFNVTQPLELSTVVWYRTIPVFRYILVHPPLSWVVRYACQYHQGRREAPAFQIARARRIPSCPVGRTNNQRWWSTSPLWTTTRRTCVVLILYEKEITIAHIGNAFNVKHKSENDGIEWGTPQ